MPAKRRIDATVQNRSRYYAYEDKLYDKKTSTSIIQIKRC